MAWSVVDSGGFAIATTAALQFTPNVAVNADDLMVIMACTNPATTTAPTPTGWTAGPVENVSASMRSWAFWKWAAGTENGVAQAWTGSQWTTSATKAVAWIIVRGVNKTEWNAMTDGERFAIASFLSTTSESVPTLTTDTAWKFGHVSLWNERSSTESTASDLLAPSGYTLTSDITFRTGSGVCQAAVAWPTALPEETDGSVGSGSWTNLGAGGITLLTVGFPTGAALTRISKTTSTTWNTRARVAKTTATTWETRARLTKTTATTWDVASPLTRITKTTATTWDVAAAMSRITKSTATTWDVRARIAKTTATTWATRARVAKTQATTWAVGSLISEAAWPAYIGHRGSDPGPEETLYAYDTLWGRSPDYWHEGDLQTLNDGTTMVGSHDDTINRMYASGPVSSGNISAMTPTQWDATMLHVNSGFSGSDRPAMRVSAWTAKYGRAGSAGTALGLWEVKTGTDVADALVTMDGQQGSVILNCNSLADAQAVQAAGFSAAYQTNTPNFTQFTANGIKYLSINETSMTGTIGTNAAAAGVKVLVYTINSTAERDSMLALVPNSSDIGFISNKPQTIDDTTRITKTTSTTWNVRARVAKTQATTFDVRSRVAKTIATTWSTRTRVAKTTATTWNVRARVAKAQSTTWDVAGVLSRVSKSTATTWNTRARIIATRSTTWDTRARLVKATATTYDVRARLTKATPSSWDVRARVGKATATTWDIRQRVTAAQGTTYDVRSRVVATRSTTWHVEVVTSGGDGGRIISARLRIPSTRGELRILTTDSRLRIPTARGALR